MSVLTLRSRFVTLVMAVLFMLSLFAVPVVADGHDPEEPDPRGIGVWSSADPLPRGDHVNAVIWFNFNATLFLAR